MVWNHQVAFCPAPNQVRNSNASRPLSITNKIDPQTDYFYPFAQQLQGNEAPAFYAQILAALGNSEAYYADQVRIGGPEAYYADQVTTGGG